jgi:acyl carrier protein
MIEDLISQLKQEIISELHVENVTPERLDPEAPLFGEGGLGLDSVDALEVVVLLDEKYGIKIKASKEGREILYSIKTIAEYILAHQKK